MFTVRRARVGDAGRIRDLFVASYGEGYPFKDFYDTDWITRLVLDEGTIVMVGEVDGEVAITATVNLSVGAMEDMVGEGGRLVAAPDERVRGRNFALELSRQLFAGTTDRVQFLFAEARTRHRASQRILQELGWAEGSNIAKIYPYSKTYNYWVDNLLTSGPATVYYSRTGLVAVGKLTPLQLAQEMDAAVGQ